MNEYLYEKHLYSYRKALEMFSDDTINLVEYTFINTDYLSCVKEDLSNIYKIMTILYGNQVNVQKEDYLKLFAYYVKSLVDLQREKFDEIFKPNGKIFSIKNILSEEALDYVNSHGLGDLRDVGERMISDINNASNNDLRHLLGACSVFSPFVDEYNYNVCNNIIDEYTTNLDIDFDYNMTLKATEIGDNSSTKDTIYDLSCYVEGTKYNATAYLSTDSIVSNAFNECLNAVVKIYKRDNVKEEKTLSRVQPN